MKYAVAAIVLLFALLAGAQEIKHAPTVAQCRADAALWSDDYQLNKYEEFRYGTTLSWNELRARTLEIIDCIRIDKSREAREVYDSVSHSIAAESWERAENFITRHGLWDQYMAEDTAGKR